MQPVTDAGEGTAGGPPALDDVTVLLVEDDLGDRELFAKQVQTGGLRPEVVAVGTLAAALDALDGATDLDIVLLDLGLPDSQGLDTLDRVTATDTPLPVIVLTGQGDDPALAVAALRQGAHDYLVKGQTGRGELARAIRYAIERHRMQRRTSAQMLHQAAMHQLEMTGGATTDLRGFAQAAASAIQVGLDARRVSLRLTGSSGPGVAAVTAAGQPLTPGTAGVGDDAEDDAEHDAMTVVQLRGEDGPLGRIEVVPATGTELTADQQRFLAAAAASITTRVERLVASLELNARTRQLDTVQRVAEQLQLEREPSAAVARVAGLLREGLHDEDELGVRVEVEGHVADAGPTGGRAAVAMEAVVTVRGEALGSIRLLGEGEPEPGPEERTVLEGVAAQLGTWWALARADREHRRDVDRIAQLMETAPVGLVLVDVDGRPRFANAAALLLVGADTLDDFPWSFDEPARDGLDPALAAVAGVRRTGTPVRDVRVSIPLEDGTERVLAVNASPLVPGPRGGRGMAMSIIDVTHERRRAVLLESALDREQRSAEELRRVSELKDGFLRALSHELRTPLASIVGFVETLKDHRDDLAPEQADTMLLRLESNAQRLGLLLEDLLDVGRITAGVRSPPNRTEHDLSDVVVDIVQLLPTDDHVVELDLTPTRAIVDRPKVERVVHNLVGNAIRHTPPGTTIRVATRRQEHAAVLVVDDDGPGIPSRERSDVFEPFVQGDRAAASPNPGTGVGLSLVRQFVELHDGTVELDVGPAGGARFTVVLPD